MICKLAPNGSGTFQLSLSGSIIPDIAQHDRGCLYLDKKLPKHSQNMLVGLIQGRNENGVLADNATWNLEYWQSYSPRCASSSPRNLSI